MTYFVSSRPYEKKHGFKKLLLWKPFKKMSILTLQEAGGADSARPEDKLRFWYILVIQLTRKNLTFPK